ncbi:MAG TPA: PhzF family phenazine biosynthesis protein [Terriglobales bacterium]|nr:PhzF family phenazine biosynthesis protein [Terriglobales bacterium]
MRLPIFQLDAFTSRRFGGNPAAVVLLKTFPDDSAMQAIAMENNLSETAFLVPEGDDFRVRWFTPRIEVPLCGHATLASAAVIMERQQLGRKSVVFHSASGPLTVSSSDAGYAMNFPARPSTSIPASAALVEALGVGPEEVLINAFNYMAVLASESAVRQLVPDMAAIVSLDRPGVIVTAAAGRGYDFVSRYFAPAKGVPEDPATGAAHCMLAPYWAQRLGKAAFRAFQASLRGGELSCRVAGDRVQLEGHCVFYMEGEIEV